MNNLNVTTEQAGRCLRLLQSAEQPIVAAKLAGMLGFVGSRESKRRHVRAIIKQLRDCGEMIVADSKGGYWLTDDKSVWKNYLEGRQIEAKKTLCDTHEKRKAVLTDASGQELLFDNRVPVGCAMRACL